MNTKITDRAIYEAIANDTLSNIDSTILTAWAEKKIAQLDHKAAKPARRARYRYRLFQNLLPLK